MGSAPGLAKKPRAADRGLGIAAGARRPGLAARAGRALNRLDPGFVQLERAVRVTLTAAASLAALYVVAVAADLPTQGVWLGMTLAEYLAWFITGSTRARRLGTSVAGLAAGFGGLLLGLWLDGTLWAVALAATALTGGAFLVGAWSAHARVAALAMPYVMVFAVYFDLPDGHARWYAGAVLGAGALALAIRFLLWRDTRAPTRAALVCAQLDRLAALPAQAARRRDPRWCLWGLRQASLPIETDLSQGEPEDRRLARRLIQLRVHMTDRVAGGRAAAGGTDAARLRRLADRIAARDRRPVVDDGWADRRIQSAARADAGGPDRRTTAARRAAQVAVALAAALPLGMWLSPDRWAWSYLAAMLVFYGTDTAEDVLAKGWRRMTGTLSGGAAGLAAADLLHGSMGVQIAAIAVLQVLAVFLQPLSYAGSMAATTALLVLFFGASGQAVPSIVTLRLGETLAGALAGLLAARLVFPRHAGQEAHGAMAGLLRELAVFLESGAPLHEAAPALGARIEPLRAATEPVRTLRIARWRRDDAEADRWFAWAEQAVRQAERARVTGRVDPRAQARAARLARALGQALDRPGPAPPGMGDRLARIARNLSAPPAGPDARSGDGGAASGAGRRPRPDR